MRVLFIGGTGVLSTATSLTVLKKGVNLFHLNRGNTTPLLMLGSVNHLKANIRDRSEVERVLRDMEFDAVVDFISFFPEHIEQNLELLHQKTGQYIFISSASAYQKPPKQLPIVESTPLENPFWQYSRDKIACEHRLVDLSEKYSLNYTIVRPSHTYDASKIPVPGKFTTLQRMLDGKPVVVPGDGTSIWTLTHHTDFAVGLAGLIGNPLAMNEIFHITSDEWLTWNRIYELMAGALGVKPLCVHIPSEVISRYDQEMGDGLLGDKSHSTIFDNSKIKRVVPEFNCKIPFETGAREIVDWFMKNPAQQVVDPALDKLFDQMIEEYGTLPGPSIH